MSTLPRQCGAFGRYAPQGVSLATLVQLPKEGVASVSPSPFSSLQDLSSIMNLVPPSQLRAAAEHVGFTVLSEETITLASGKQFCLQVFNLSG